MQRRETQRAQELEAQIRADAERQRAERARKTRERSESDATETGGGALVDEGAQVVSFPEEVVWEGIKFSHVKLFQSHKGVCTHPAFGDLVLTVYRVPGYGVAGGADVSERQPAPARAPRRRVQLPVLLDGARAQEAQVPRRRPAAPRESAAHEPAGGARVEAVAPEYE